MLFSKERSDWQNPGNNIASRPSLLCKNSGSYIITDLHIYYYVYTDIYPVVVSDLTDYADKATISIEEFGDDFYAIHIEYSDVDLNPGDSISGINFEISNTDNSPWIYNDDPSFICTDDPLYNDKILVMDGNANIMSGRLLDDIVALEGIYPVTLEAMEQTTSPEVSRPAFRLLNGGGATLNTFKVFYYFSVEDGRTPVYDAIRIQNCEIDIENISNDQYRMVYSYTDVHFEPGAVFPDSLGTIVELHYDDMNIWDRSNDYSSDELDDSWKFTYNIVVEDMDGNLYWGQHPE